jgi:hypothetical protein
MGPTRFPIGQKKTIGAADWLLDSLLAQAFLNYLEHTMDF